MIKFLVVTSLLLVSCSGTASTLPRYAVDSEMLEDVNDSVVVLLQPAPSYSPRPFTVFCAGAFVTDIEILTAAHCVRDMTDVRVGSYSDSRMTNGVFHTGNWRSYKVVNVDRVHDLALLRYSDSRTQVRHSVISFAQSDPEVGENVVLVGHPGGLTWTPSVGMVSTPRRQGWGLNTTQDAHVVHIQHQAPAFPGNSGGPVVNFDGQSVGVVTGSITGATHLVMSIHISHIRDFLYAQDGQE